MDKILNEKVESGKKISPVLPDGVKNYLIDIDGTITEMSQMKSLKEWRHVCHLMMHLKHVIDGTMKVI